MPELTSVRGDGTAFERAMLPHLPSAYRTALWLVRDPALAEDVVQDAFVRALAAFGQWRGDEPRAWLLQIVRRVGLDALERRGRRQEVGEEALLEMSDPADAPDLSLARREERTRLHRLLAALPDELRECLVLRELEECSYKEISQVTGVPIGTVMSRLWRARRLLLQGAQAVAP